MKIKFNYFVLVLIISAISATLTSCGGSEKPEEKAEEPKTNTADLFTDDRPAYDSKAIDAAAPVTEINMTAAGQTMTDIHYDPKVITVKAGTTVKLKFVNKSTDASMPHNWVLVHFGTMEAVATAGISGGIDGTFVPDSKDVLVYTKLLGPNEETEISFPAPPAGKYQFVCTYPGHWSVMNGEFIVE